MTTSTGSSRSIQAGTQDAQKEQEENAKSVLKYALTQQHSSNELADRFICAIGFALIELGVSSTATAFEMKHVPCTLIGDRIMEIKQHTVLASTSLKAIISTLSLQRYFIRLGESKNCMAACWPELLPDASNTIRNLLPNIPWQPAQHVAPAPKKPGVTARNDAQSSTSSGSKIVARHGLFAQHGPPAQQAQQLPLQQPMCSAIPLAAIVVDLGLRQPGKQSRRMYIVKRAALEHLITTVAFEENSLQHVLSGVQRQLDDAGVNVTFNCHAMASAMPKHASIAPQQVFDVQVAEGVLDHMRHFPDSSYCPQQCSLQELLESHGLEQKLYDGQDGTGIYTMILEGTQLLSLAERQMACLGQEGIALIMQLSQAWFRSALPSLHTGSADTYSKRAQTPLNTDLEMTFADDHKPSFDRYLPSNSQQSQEPAMKQGDASRHASDPLGDAVRSMLRYLPTEVRDAIILYFLACDEPTDKPEQDEAIHIRQLNEIVADKQREVLLRFSNGPVVQLPLCMDIEHAVDKLASVTSSDDSQNSADPFRKDNRMGFEGTLHRISAMRDRHGIVIGLTYRIGRHIQGAGDILLDVLSMLNPSGGEECGASSLLLLGPPGVGKTTLLRSIVQLLADKFEKRVIVVDTSNEIGGDGAVPHACLGKARRMSPADRAQQHEVLLEAVQNHTPEVIVIDEIGGVEEVKAVKSIAQRGVVMVATAHGVSLTNLIKNPDLNGLVGGVCQVTVGDAAAKGNNKTKSERRGAPVFSCLVEVLSHDTLRLHPNVAASVDAILAGKQPATQLRKHKDGKFIVRFETPEAPAKSTTGKTVAASSWLANLAELAKKAC